MDVRLAKQIKEAIPSSYHPQYNWDLSKDIAEEDLELFKLAVTHCPAGQDNNTYFKVHFIKDRDAIQKIYDELWVDSIGEDATQTQILANLLVVFENWDNDSILHRWDVQKYEVDRATAAGMSVGYLELLCALLGNKTGQLNCADKVVQEEIKKSLGFDDVPLLMIGIGHKNENVSPHRSHFDRTIKHSVHRRTPPIYIKVWE